MRTLLRLSSFLLTAAVTVAAQSAATGTVLMQQQPFSQDCPVNLSASRLPGGGMARVTSDPKPKGEPFHLTFRSTDEQGIAQADLVLHGMSGTQVIPAGTRAGADATETFSVSPFRDGDHLFNSVVYMRRLTAVNYVELKSITFADGREWHASATSTCRVTPNGFQLVASGR